MLNFIYRLLYYCIFIVHVFFFFLESTKIVALAIFGILKLISAKVSLKTSLIKVKVNTVKILGDLKYEKKSTVNSPISIVRRFR